MAQGFDQRDNNSAPERIFHSTALLEQAHGQLIKEATRSAELGIIDKKALSRMEQLGQVTEASILELGDFPALDIDKQEREVPFFNGLKCSGYDLITELDRSDYLTGAKLLTEVFKFINDAFTSGQLEKEFIDRILMFDNFEYQCLVVNRLKEDLKPFLDRLEEATKRGLISSERCEEMENEPLLNIRASYSLQLEALLAQ